MIVAAPDPTCTSAGSAPPNSIDLPAALAMVIPATEFVSRMSRFSTKGAPRSFVAARLPAKRSASAASPPGGGAVPSSHSAPLLHTPELDVFQISSAKTLLPSSVATLPASTDYRRRRLGVFVGTVISGRFFWEESWISACKRTPSSRLKPQPKQVEFGEGDAE